MSKSLLTAAATMGSLVSRVCNEPHAWRSMSLNLVPMQHGIKAPQHLSSFSFVAAYDHQTRLLLHQGRLKSGCPSQGLKLIKRQLLILPDGSACVEESLLCVRASTSLRDITESPIVLDPLCTCSSKVAASASAMCRSLFTSSAALSLDAGTSGISRLWSD